MRPLFWWLRFKQSYYEPLLQGYLLIREWQKSLLLATEFFPGWIAARLWCLLRKYIESSLLWYQGEGLMNRWALETNDTKNG